MEENEDVRVTYVPLLNGMDANKEYMGKHYL